MNKVKLFSIYATAVFGLVAIFTFSFFKVYHIPTSSMDPTYPAGSYVFCTKIFDRDDITTGDIIAFSTKNISLLKGYNKNSVYLMRVAAIKGDTVSLQNNILKINGVEVSVYQDYPTFEPFEGNHIVSDGQVFVLGDNRNNSLDSRYFGMVPILDVVSMPVSKN